jgi:MFS family permease
MLGAVFLGSFAFFHYDAGFNQHVRFNLTRAIVERGTFTIDAYHENTLDKAYRDGHYYCDKPPGVSFLAVPGYFVAYHAIRALGGDPTGARGQRWGFYVARVTSVALLGALLGVVFLHAVSPFCPPTWTVVVTVGLALGTLAFPYSTLLYGHQVAATGLFAAFAVLLAHRRRTPQRARALACAGLAAAVAGTSEYPVFLLAGGLGIYLLTGPRPARSGAWFVAGATLPVAGLLVYHTICFGSPFSTGFAHEALPFWRAKYGTGFYGLRAPSAEALVQLTVGSHRGLLYQAPWLVLAAPGLWHLIVDRRWWAEAALVVAMAIVMLAVNASLHSWDGGWTMGARYLIPIVPFLAFAAAFARGRVAWILAAVLVPASVLFMLAGAAVRPEVPVFVANPLLDYLLPFLRAGKLSMPDPTGEAFNLGEALGGLAGLWSLVPLLALWLAGAAGVLVTIARRRDGLQ